MCLSREVKELITLRYAVPVIVELAFSAMTVPNCYDKFLCKFVAYMTHFSDSSRQILDSSSDSFAFKNFFKLYVLEDDSKLIAPGFSHAAVQTYLRECIAEYDFYHRQTKNSLHSLRTEVQASENNFYAVGEVVETTVMKKDFLRNPYYAPLRSIDEKILRKSYDHNPDGQIRIFKNLYHGLEYLAFVSPKVHTSTKVTPSHVRSLWAVRYSGFVDGLAGYSEEITLNATSTDKRKAIISYAEVQKWQIHPILGTVLEAIDINGLYFKALNMTDMRKLIVEEKPKETCRLM